MGQPTGDPGSRAVPAPSGEPLIELIAVMDRLRSPGGCPWDAEQTHESLVSYLTEEAHEAVEAIETGDRAAMREELGDVLLQVMFHSRIAQEHDADPWSIDDVAAGIAAKLRGPPPARVRRRDGRLSGPRRVRVAGPQDRGEVPRLGPRRHPHRAPGAAARRQDALPGDARRGAAAPGGRGHPGAGRAGPRRGRDRRGGGPAARDSPPRPSTGASTRSPRCAAPCAGTPIGSGLRSRR